MDVDGDGGGGGGGGRGGGRDYRLLQLDNNNTTILGDHDHDMAEQSASDAPAPASGVEGAGAGAAPVIIVHRPDQNTWNYSHTSEDYDMSVQQVSPVEGPVFQLAPHQDHTFQVLAVESPAPQMSTVQVPEVQVQPTQTQPTTIRKRNKTISYSSASCQDEDSEGSRSGRSVPRYKKQTHNEIEKRRRDKMNAYISQLSSMVPLGPGEGSATRKLDKISVLKAVVHYLRGVRGTLAAAALTATPPDTYLTEDELNSLVMSCARDGDLLLIVVGCDRGRLLYVSTSVRKMLHYDQSELVGQSIFNMLHPKDVAMFKDQLSPTALTTRHDVKVQGELSGGGASRFCSGARRAFFCRIKCKPASASSGESSMMNNNPDSLKKNQKKYCIIQFTGYLKTWIQDETSEMDTGVGGEGDDENLSCLVAVGRALSDLVELTPAPVQPPPVPAETTPAPEVQAPTPEEQPPPPPLRPVQYMSRHAVDGKYLFADPRVTIAVGYLPQELVGTSLYVHVDPSHRDAIAQAHKQALLKREKLLTPPYSFKKKDGTSVWLHSHVKPFRNPWTKEEEHIVANNTVVAEPPAPAPPPAGAEDRSDLEKASEDIERGVEEEVSGQAATPGPFVQGASLDKQTPLQLDVDTSCFHGRRDVLMGAGVEVEGVGVGVGVEGVGEGCSSLELDGNDEAAMSVIMSLLEADAGLGGPVCFSDLPWPQP